MTIFKPRACLALFILFVLPINGKIMAQALQSLNATHGNSANEEQTNPSDRFLRPINPNDPREAGVLWAMPESDGRLRISPMRQWSETGLELHKGQRLEIQAEGHVKGCQRPVSDWAYGPWGPAGGPANDDPDSRVCALIGRIVGEGETHEFIVGESYQCEVSADGKLELGVSDVWHFDNSGEFIVAIQVDGKPVDFAQHQSTQGKSKYEIDMEGFINEVDRSYPFFDLKGMRSDWEKGRAQLLQKAKACRSDQEFLGLVLTACKSLRDAHLGPRSFKVDFPPQAPKYYPGISFLPATDGRVVVMHPREGMDPKIKAGTIVTKIDGKDARGVLEARSQAAWKEGGPFSSPQRARLYEFRIPLRGEVKGQTHKITVIVDGEEQEIELVADIEARGWPHTYNLPQDLKQVGRSAFHTQLPSGVGYIYLRRVDDSAEPGVTEAIAAHPNVKGWIVDLRGNGGGGYGASLQQKLQTLRKPLACLIDAGCISAGETLARDLVNMTQARLFGSRTAGASSAKRIWNFPSGIGAMSFPTRSRWGIGGELIEYNGIAPHVEVEAVPEELQEGLNSAILRAEEYILSNPAESIDQAGSKQHVQQDVPDDQSAVTGRFLRPIRAGDWRENGDLWAIAAPDGRLRISPLRQWSHTGVELQKGQDLVILAEGSVQGCQRPVGSWAYGPFGPAGGPATDDPGSRVCALIGRIVGEETHEFIVGDSYRCKVPADGKLELGVSDVWHFDNSGEFVVLIEVDGKRMNFAERRVANINVATKNLAPAMELMSEAEVSDLDGARRITSPRGAHRPMLVTLQQFSPPLEIRARARTDSTNIRLYYGSFGQGFLIFNWEVRPDQLRIHDPATGSGQGVQGAGGIEKDEFHDIVWRIGLQGMQVLVDGEERYRGEGDYRDLLSPVAIGPALGSTIEVESVIIAPLDPAVMNIPSDSTTELAFQELRAIPPAEDLPGRLVFHGKYLHRSRGREYGESAVLWVKEQKDGSIVALSEFADQATLAVGDADHRPSRYSTVQGTYKIHLKLEKNRVLQLREWSDEQAEKEYATDEGAIFDPNTRPDPYVMANILVRRFHLQAGDSKQFLMCDWGAAGDKQDTFPSYRVRVEHRGKEKVTVPAGTFEANHVVQTQLTPSYTWFKKRVGHVTEFWYLDDYTIVRILRHREPYEVLLQEYSAPGSATDNVNEAHVERVPLVTEESLATARRLLPILLQMAKRAGDLSEVEVKEDIPSPSSHGNTITGVDIVLNQAGMDVK